MEAGLCKLLTWMTLIGVATGYVRICYFTNWSQYRPSLGKYVPQDIDPFLCTHIAYAFNSIEGTAVKKLEWNDDTIMRGVVAHKNQNPSLKILLALGGWTVASAPFVALVASETSMRQFSANVISFLRQRNMDGLDLDWEYPGDRGSTAADIPRFTRWVQILREDFENEARQTGRERLLLTAAVHGLRDNLYEPDKLGLYLDYVGLMSYDFHGAWESTTGHHSLLSESSQGVERWLSKGFPREKLVMGVPMYGKSFTLTGPPTSNNGLGQSASGGASAGPYSLEQGTLGYIEICEKLNAGWTLGRPTENAAVAYGLNGQTWEWVGFDDAESLRTKAQYIRNAGLAGVMMWDLNSDDFRNTCGQGRYPLLNTLYRELPNTGTPVTQPTVPTQPTTTTTTTRRPTTPTTTTTTTTTTQRPTTTTTTTRTTPPTTTPRRQASNWPSYFGCSPRLIFGFSAGNCSPMRMVDRTSFYLYCSRDRFLALICRCFDGLVFNSAFGACTYDTGF